MATKTMDELITEVRLTPSNHDVILANGSFTVMDLLAVKFTVVKGKDGPFVSLPRQKSRKEENKWYDEVFPITKEGRIALNKRLIAEYENMKKAAPQASSAQAPF